MNNILRALSSLKLGMILLLLAAGGAAFGTLVPQGGPRWSLFLIIPLAVNISLCCMFRLRGLKSLKNLGSFFIHAGLLVLLAGALISGLTRHEAYLELGEGDEVNLSSFGFAPWILSVKDFRIAYYNNDDPRQYFTDLSLKMEHGDALRGRISVNHPMKAGGLKIYQAGYGCLKIKHDPGVAFVFAGFIIASLGLISFWCLPESKKGQKEEETCGN